VPHSTLLLAQKARLEGAVGSYECKLLWLDASKDVLDARLDARVEKMLSMGLLAEVRALRELIRAAPRRAPSPSAAAAGAEPAITNDDADTDANTGLLIAIGYKEFAAYFDAVDAASAGLLDLSAPVAPPKKPKKKTDTPRKTVEQSLLDACIASLKAVTKHYARKQERWIRNRFIGRGFPVVKLDTANVEAWDTAVFSAASSHVEALLTGGGDLLRAVSDADKVHGWKKYVCDACEGKQLNGDLEWTQHLATAAHRRNAAALARTAASSDTP
jgi:tRNA dimethylallyltransferase